MTETVQLIAAVRDCLSEMDPARMSTENLRALLRECVPELDPARIGRDKLAEYQRMARNEVPGTYRTVCASCGEVVHSDAICSCGCKVTRLFHIGKNGLTEIR